MNIESIASKASDLNKRVIRKIESGDGVKIKQLISSKVWEDCKNLEIRRRVRTEFNHIFLSDN
jgi:ribosomal protein L31E